MLPDFIRKRNHKSKFWHIFKKEEVEDTVYYHIPLCGRKFGVYEAELSLTDPMNAWATKEPREFTDMDSTLQYLCVKCKTRYIDIQVKQFKEEMEHHGGIV